MMPSSRHAASCHRRRSLGSSCIYSVLRRPFSCAGWSACGMPPPQPEPRRQHDMVSTSRCVSIPYECSSAVRFYSAAAAGSATRCTLSGALSVLLPGFAKAPSCKQLLLNRVLSCLVFRAARACVCVCSGVGWWRSARSGWRSTGTWSMLRQPGTPMRLRRGSART